MNNAASARYAIIGSGAAGLAAAEAIRSRDPAGEILLISEDPFGYYSRPGLAYFLTGELPERYLYPFTPADFDALRLRRLQAQVVRIEPEAHMLILANRTPIPYDRLLIAAGSTAQRVSTPGADLEGVVKLDNLEDARRIHAYCKKGRAAVVVGGGITALEIVEGLRARGMQVTYFLRGARYWSNVLDETESRIIEHRLAEEGVRIAYHTELAEIVGRKGRVEAARATDGRTFPCELLAVAIGVRARKELAEVSGLRTGRGILVDEKMHTSHADIFAAGDVAEFFDPFTGHSILNTLWGPARRQGAIAGENIAGGEVSYAHEVSFNVTRLAGLTTTIIGMVGRGEDENLVGIARGDSETWRQLPEAIAAEKCFDVNRLRLLIGETTLLGAVVMGDQTLSQPLQRLVSAQADIRTVRSALMQPGAPLGDIILRFYQLWSQTNARISTGAPQ